MDVLDSISELAPYRPAKTGQRLKTLAPIIDQITVFTDGDETNHVRSEFIETVAKIVPEKIPNICSHHLEEDDHYYAVRCFTELVCHGDLSQPETVAVIATVLDARTLRVLAKRAVEDPQAQALLDRQVRFLGGIPTDHEERYTNSSDEPSQRQIAAESVAPTSIPPNEISALIAAAEAVHYRSRDAFIAKWVSHWHNAGRGVDVINAVKAFIDSERRPLARMMSSIRFST